MPIATITSKGQVTIPLEVRERLRLKAGDRIDFRIDAKGEVTLASKRVPFEEIQGMLRIRNQKAVSVREMDDAIARAVQQRWKRARRNAK